MLLGAVASFGRHNKYNYYHNADRAREALEEFGGYAMTISKKVFEEIKRQNPQITYISGTNDRYRVVFNDRKIYTYRARSLSELCRRLGVKAIRQYEIDNINKALKRAIQSHGTRNIFCRNGAVIDNSEEIARYRKLLEKYKDYVVLD